MKRNQNHKTHSQSPNCCRTRAVRSALCLGALAFALAWGAAAAAPTDVTVDRGLPLGSPNFWSIQSALSAVASGGTVHVAPGTYIEDIILNAPVTLLGPNAGKAGNDPSRGPEAILLPAIDDVSNGQIIYLAANDVVIDGFLFNGANPALTDGFLVGPPGPSQPMANTSAAVQNTYYWLDGFASVNHFRIQNNIIKNISYDGIYVELPLGATSGTNYILNNLFDTMWEGLQTYAVHSVISNNTFLSVNRGLSVHGTTTAAPPTFTPVIANNTFTIGEWWPTQIERHYTEGVWVNYRRQNAAPLDVSGNVVNTPAAAPGTNRIRGFYAITIDGSGQVNFLNNTVNGAGHCHEGVRVALSPNPGAVTVQAGSLNGISDAGVSATTSDFYGTNDVAVTVSNVSIAMSSGSGVRAFQDPGTLANHAQVSVINGCAINGATAAVLVSGPGSSAIVTDNSASFTANHVGVIVDAGQALLQHNNLTGNSEAAIRVWGGGLVDAGDCTHAGPPGLTTLGVSSGANDLSGYNFAGGGPWAVDNQGGTVLAYLNNFGVGLHQNIANLMNGPVDYSQNAPFATPPPDLTVECVTDVPTPTTPLADYFVAHGGIASASQFTVSFTDVPPGPWSPGNTDIARTWTVTDTCGNHPPGVVQTIHVRDTIPPTIACPADILQPVDSGQNYATVTFSPTASDTCSGLQSLIALPPSGAHFVPGTHPVLVTATDNAGNSSYCTFYVTVIPLPTITADPSSQVKDAGTSVSFTVAASSPPGAPLSFQWSKNGSPIANATTTILQLNSLVGTDSATYRVRVTNLAGSVDSDPATLAVLEPLSLRLVTYSRVTGAATLRLTGTAGLNYTIQASADLLTWHDLDTDTSPFTFTDLSPGTAHRFYRAVYTP